jgi:hypothetical protein
MGYESLGIYFTKRSTDVIPLTIWLESASDTLELAFEVRILLVR